MKTKANWISSSILLTTLISQVQNCSAHGHGLSSVFSDYSVKEMLFNSRNLPLNTSNRAYTEWNLPAKFPDQVHGFEANPETENRVIGFRDNITHANVFSFSQNYASIIFKVDLLRDFKLARSINNGGLVSQGANKTYGPGDPIPETPVFWLDLKMMSVEIRVANESSTFGTMELHKVAHPPEFTTQYNYVLKKVSKF